MTNSAPKRMGRLYHLLFPFPLSATPTVPLPSRAIRTLSRVHPKNPHPASSMEKKVCALSMEMKVASDRRRAASPCVAEARRVHPWQGAHRETTLDDLQTDMAIEVAAIVGATAINPLDDHLNRWLMSSYWDRVPILS